MDIAIQKAWETAIERFFCPETHLFYEYVYDEAAKAWDNLPTLDQISSAYPNPCSWGTGMEDSVMNGSMALDMLICYGNNGKQDETKELTEQIFNGLLKCTENNKNKGFLARSISPIDLKSHYPESSRDQYTHLIYTFLNFYFSPICTSCQRDQIRNVISNIAEKCINEVIPENNYNMLREDGTIGKVNKMWGDVATHEWMRLPMFYLAAYVVTENKKYRELYLKYRDEALEKSLSYEPEKVRCFCSLQMQCSLRSIYDFDTDSAFRSGLLSLMNRIADYGEYRSVENSKIYTQPCRNAEVNSVFKPWNAGSPYDEGLFGGYRYYIYPVGNDAVYPVREVGEGAIITAICPNRAISDELIDSIKNMASVINFKKYSCVYALLYLPYAYTLCTMPLQSRRF